MGLQWDVLNLMAEEDFIYEDGFNLDKELNYVACMECPFVDFNFRLKVKF